MFRWFTCVYLLALVTLGPARLAAETKTLLDHQTLRAQIAGKLAKVTDRLTRLSQLADADFHDAAVEIDSIAVVVVRVRSN